jgi:hypothetical protein
VIGLYLGIFLLVIGVVLKIAHIRHDSHDGVHSAEISDEPHEFGI